MAKRSLRITRIVTFRNGQVLNGKMTTVWDIAKGIASEVELSVKYNGQILKEIFQRDENDKVVMMDGNGTGNLSIPRRDLKRMFMKADIILFKKEKEISKAIV